MVKGAIDHPLYIVVSGDMAVAVNLAGADDGINYKWIAAIPGKFYFSAPSSSIFAVPSAILHLSKLQNQTATQRGQGLRCFPALTTGVRRTFELSLPYFRNYLGEQWNHSDLSGEVPSGGVGALVFQLIICHSNLIYNQITIC